MSFGKVLEKFWKNLELFIRLYFRWQNRLTHWSPCTLYIHLKMKLVIPNKYVFSKDFFCLHQYESFQMHFCNFRPFSVTKLYLTQIITCELSCSKILIKIWNDFNDLTPAHVLASFLKEMSSTEKLKQVWNYTVLY